MRRAVLAGVLVGAFAGFFLVAEDIALVIAAVLVGGAWVTLVLLGDGERELQRFERTWAPLLDPPTGGTPSQPQLRRRIVPRAG